MSEFRPADVDGDPWDDLLNDAFCQGFDDASFEHDVAKLCSLCFRIVHSEMNAELKQKLVEAALEVTAWFEEDNDPRSMGWVGDDGLP